MSVVGFDLGNETSVVAVARQRGIDVVLNEESKRETPSLVCFGDKQRFIGTAGAASSVMNPKNTVSQIKRLIGRKFSDTEVQSDLKMFPYTVVAGQDDVPSVHVRYLGEERTFTPTQILAMILSNLKSIAEKNLNIAVVDCCISIPIYFTDLQRRAVQDAAKIAGLHPLRLMHETTATALAYGIYKTDLPENEYYNVAFVDVGHASMQVCIVGFKKGQLKVLGHSFDRSLGGRDFDEVLFHYFAQKFKVEYKIDVFQNARACTRLRVACEKLKKVLSANPEAPLNIECLMDEKDVRGFIKREEFEQISISILQRVKGPLEKALSDAGLSVGDIHCVELVGSGSRVPAVTKIVHEFFGKEPRRTLNASECVARGCALQCAILSPTFKVREFQVQESFPFSIALSWKVPESDGSTESEKKSVVFPKGCLIPLSRAVTFLRPSTFSVDFVYDDVNEVQAPPKISTYVIGPFQATQDKNVKLKVKVNLNIHGIVSVDSATMLEEEGTEIPVAVGKEPLKESTKMETDDSPTESSTAANDVDMQDAKVALENSGDVVSGLEEKVESKQTQVEADTKVEVAKRKVKKTNVKVTEYVYGGLPAADLQVVMEQESTMALQDKVMEDTKDKKNAVEAYVYDMRNKLHDKYHDFVKDLDREKFSLKLQETEDWLYDEGEDETRGVYVKKLEELKTLGDPIEARYKEYFERGPLIDQLNYCIGSFKNAALSNDPKFDHIDIAEKEKVIKECSEAELWLKGKLDHQNALSKHDQPVLVASDIKKKAETLDRFCRPIMMKPKPAPPKPQTPPTETAQPTTPPQPQTPEQPQPAGANEVPEHSPGQGDASNPAGEPMETDSSEKPAGAP